MKWFVIVITIFSISCGGGSTSPPQSQEKSSVSESSSEDLRTRIPEEKASPTDDSEPNSKEADASILPAAKEPEDNSGKKNTANSRMSRDTREDSDALSILKEPGTVKDEANLSLQINLLSIEVFNDGASGSAEWRFAISINDQVKINLQRKVYDADERNIITFYPGQRSTVVSVDYKSFFVFIEGRNWDNDDVALGKLYLSPNDWNELLIRSILRTSLYVSAPYNRDKGYFKFHLEIIKLK